MTTDTATAYTCQRCRHAGEFGSTIDPYCFVCGQTPMVADGYTLFCGTCREFRRVPTADIPDGATWYCGECRPEDR